MLVLPHYELSSDPVVVTPQSRKVDGWMRDLARSRRKTCVADWPAYVRSHPGILAGRRAHQARRRGPLGALDLPAVAPLLVVTAGPSGPVVTEGPISR